MQIHLSDLLIQSTHELPGLWARHEHVQAAMNHLRTPLQCQEIKPDLIRRKRSGASRKEPKNSEVTWCYNPQEDLTLFGSTLVAQHNKLNDIPVGRNVGNTNLMLRRVTGRRCLALFAFRQHAQTESDNLQYRHVAYPISTYRSHDPRRCYRSGCGVGVVYVAGLRWRE
jgi:hypothetical protein